MQFDYLYTMQAQGTIEIEDIGNFALSITNDLYNEYIIIVKTTYGVSEIIQFGPHKIDFEQLEDRVNYNYIRTDYNESRLSKIIDNYINDPKKMVTQVSLITFEEARKRIINLVDVIFK